VFAATLNFGDKLTITSGSAILDANDEFVIGFTGSYFGVDTLGEGGISQYDKNPLTQGTTGLVIGMTSTPGASHDGAPLPGDTNAVTAPSAFLANTGSWYFDIAPTGSTEGGINMSGWDFQSAGVIHWNLGGLAWQPTNCADLGCSGYTFLDGVGRFQWDGIYGHAYTLDTTSSVPLGDPSGCGGCQFYTHLEGTVMAVPEPAPVWMFSAALLAMFGIARKRKV
jgi:hypothetical protein